jgi:hypothetical protein
MTEAEWLACRDPHALLEFLHAEARAWRQPQPSRRKLRLFASACCRRAWSAIADERSRKAVEVTERYADRLASRQELALAFLEAKGVHPIGNGGFAAVLAAALTGGPDRAALQAALAVDVRRWEEERAAQAMLVRDIFGSPFRPVAVLPPTWLPSAGVAVRELALAIYHAGRFDRLPLLADVLEAAGIDDAALLVHLRSPAPHVRGCWAVDHLLGKS